MDIETLTDQQILTLFKKNEATSEVRNLYLQRVKRLVKSIRYDNLDTIIDDELFKLPEVFKPLLDNFLNCNFNFNIHKFIIQQNYNIINIIVSTLS